MKTYTACGSIYEWDGEKRVSINMSSIYTALIKEAAKCENYASDVLYDIKHVEEELYEKYGMDAAKVAERIMEQ